MKDREREIVHQVSKITISHTEVRQVGRCSFRLMLTEATLHLNTVK